MPYLHDYRALLFDVDKTLTNSKREVSSLVRASLNELTERGFIIGVCTGRSFQTLKKEIMPIFAPGLLHVVSGGAQVVTTTENILYEKPISAEISAQLISALQNIHADFFVFTQQTAYITNNKIGLFATHPWAITHAPIETFTPQSTQLISVLDLNQETRQVIQKFPMLSVKEIEDYADNYYCDITANGVNKATGVSAWSELSGISPAEVIGFGDSLNDLEFLDTVGFSVAMGNAVTKVKELADRVIKPTDEDGLGMYLASILKGTAL